MPLTDVRMVHLPYCLDRQPDGRYVILNREYKPLGFKTRDRVDYGAYPIAVKLKDLTEAKAAKLSHEGSENLDRIYLYNDATVPTRSAVHMRSYLERLEVLMSLKIED